MTYAKGRPAYQTVSFAHRKPVAYCTCGLSAFAMVLLLLVLLLLILLYSC